MLMRKLKDRDTPKSYLVQKLQSCSDVDVLKLVRGTNVQVTATKAVISRKDKISSNVVPMSNLTQLLKTLSESCDFFKHSESGQHVKKAVTNLKCLSPKRLARIQKHCHKFFKKTSKVFKIRRSEIRRVARRIRSRFHRHHHRRSYSITDAESRLNRPVFLTKNTYTNSYSNADLSSLASLFGAVITGINIH